MAARQNNLLAVVAKQTEPKPPAAPAEEFPAVVASERVPAPAVVAPPLARQRRARYAETHRPHTIMLPLRLIERLDRAVEATERSKADLVRTAVDRYLQELGL